MKAEDKMTVDERRKYLRQMKKRYEEADRTMKSKLLDEMEGVTRMHRKSLIRSMNSSLKRKPRERERSKTYGPDVDDALRVIDESFDHICSERLTPSLAWMVEHLGKHGEIRTTPRLLDQLGRISVSTVQRRLNRMRQYERRLPRKKPRGRHLVQDIPMKCLSWTIDQPGHMETDRGLHGERARGTADPPA